MIRRILMLLIALAAIGCFALAATAHAEEWAGEREAGPMVQSLVPLGLAFWSGRSPVPCETVTVLVADDLGTDDQGNRAVGRAAKGECKFWLATSLVRDAHWGRRYGFPTFLRTLCAVGLHELGHIAGLDHTDGGLMAPVVAATPWDCTVWSARLARAHRR